MSNFVLDLSSIPQLPSKYQRGKIYKIVCNQCDETYVGSTCEPSLARRLSFHRSNSKKEKHKNTRLYKHVNEHGDWNNFKIVLIENYSCNSKEELLQREDYYQQQMKSNLNTYKAYRSEEEIKQYNKQRRLDHLEEYKQHDKQYYEANKEQIKQYRDDVKAQKLYYCNICDIALSKPSALIAHNQTKTHKKNEFLKNPPILVLEELKIN